MNLLHSQELESLRKENVRLLNENGELRKMVVLMQENLELRCTLRDHESRVRTLSPPAAGYKDDKDKDLKEPPHVPLCQDDLTEKPHIPQQEDNEHLQHCHQVLGEIAFQLDRRILSYIFLEQSRIYGFTVSNALEKIMQASTCPLTNNVNEVQRAEMMARYTDIMNRLKKLGYDTRVHPMVSEHLVNSYGILKKHPEPLTKEWESYNDPEVLYKIATDAAPSDSVKHVQVLLNCLVNLAKEDGKSLFIW